MDETKLETLLSAILAVSAAHNKLIQRLQELTKVQADIINNLTVSLETAEDNITELFAKHNELVAKHNELVDKCGGHKMNLFMLNQQSAQNREHFERLEWLLPADQRILANPSLPLGGIEDVTESI